MSSGGRLGVGRAAVRGLVGVGGRVGRVIRLGRVTRLGLFTLLGWVGGGELWAAPFSHEGHARAAGAVVDCTGCHPAGVEASASRPGRDDHTGCDGAGCHATGFYGPVGFDRALCQTCHVDAAPWASAGVRAFPSRARGERELCTVFSHAAHLVAERAGADGCERCHQAVGGERAPPTHADCAGCHKDASPLPMSRCEGCHALAAGGECRPWIPKGAHTVPGFDHTQHADDVSRLRATPLSCGRCHTRVAGATDVASIVLLAGPATMKGCGDCHDGRTRIPGERKRVFATSTACRRCHGAQIDVWWPHQRAPRGH